jgi:hypothetical protein
MKKINIITNGLKLYLDAGNISSYPKTGIVWSDISGNGYNGTLQGGAGFNSANSGSITFDGTDDYINLGNILDQNGSDSFTVSCWFRLNIVNQNHAIFAKEENIPNYLGYMIYVRADNRFALALINDITTDAFIVGSTTTANSNQWYNLTVTYSGTKLNTGVKIYVNSVIETNNYILGTTLVGSTSNSLNTRIGSRDSNGVPLNGRISNVQVYNRVLLQTEILQNYNALKSRYI